MKKTKIEFTAELVRETSLTSTPIGTHDCEMEFFPEPGGGLIEWVINNEEVEHIGIEVEDGVLTGYDGVFDLPREACVLLRLAGITVPAEFDMGNITAAAIEDKGKEMLREYGSEDFSRRDDVFNDREPRPGRFFWLLFDAYSCADHGNKARLMAAFPEQFLNKTFKHVAM